MGELPRETEATQEEGVEEPPLVGRVLSEKWRVDRLLGKGGVASVYEATHRNGRRAALKVLSPEFARNRRMRGRFQREGYLANRVGHPGAVAILDDDVSGDTAYLVMELLDGATLDALRATRGGRFDSAEALWVGVELLDVLEAAHARGILHRDVKPGNVFVTRSGELKLLDFGIASLREGEGAPGITETGVALGTPGFMAPEQARGRSDELGPATDVYAVGATLYRLLSGRLVHDGLTPSELTIAVATQDAPALTGVAPHVPPELARIVDRALSRDAAKRFHSAAEMRRALVEVARRSGATLAAPALDRRPETSVNASGAATPVARPSTRMARTGALVAILAALIAVLVYAGTMSAPDPNATPNPDVSVSAPRAASAPVPPSSGAPNDAELALRAAAVPAAATAVAPAKRDVEKPTAPRAKNPSPKPSGLPHPAAPSAAAPPSAKPPLDPLKQRL
jgi:serine/threonine protein kinase